MCRHSFTEVDHLWTFERRAEMPETAEIAAEISEIAGSGALTEAAEPPAVELASHLGISTACAST